MSEPSPEAMKAARDFYGVAVFDWQVLPLARALDAFAEAARKDERQAIVAWICQNHFHEDDLIEMIRQRGVP